MELRVFHEVAPLRGEERKRVVSQSTPDTQLRRHPCCTIPSMCADGGHCVSSAEGTVADLDGSEPK